MDEERMDVVESAASGETGTGDGAAVADPSVVGVFGDHRTAELAVHQLRRAGVDMKRLSIVGRDYHTEEHPVGFYNLGDRVKVWGARGAFWGGLIGLLLSPAFFFIPVVGHVVILGPLTAALVSTLGNAAVAGGASALAAGLYGVGIPRDSVLRYEAAVRADKFLLIVHRTRWDAGRAMEILKHSGAESVQAHGL